VGRTPEPLGLKLLKARSSTKDIAGRPIPTPPGFQRGVPDCPAWLSPGAKPGYTDRIGVWGGS
jgi:phage terminase small subunit